jgi:hypothetical protein
MNCWLKSSPSASSGFFGINEIWMICPASVISIDWGSRFQSGERKHAATSNDPHVAYTRGWKNFSRKSTGSPSTFHALLR